MRRPLALALRNAGDWGGHRAKAEHALPPSAAGRTCRRRHGRPGVSQRQGTGDGCAQECREAGCNTLASYGPQGGSVQFCSAHAAGRHVNQLGQPPPNKAKMGDSAHTARLAEVAAKDAKREAKKRKVDVDEVMTLRMRSGR